MPTNHVEPFLAEGNRRTGLKLLGISSNVWDTFGAMNIFYGSSEGRPDVDGNAPVSATVDTALQVFRGLNSRSGFLGINLDDRFVLQMMPGKLGKVRIELLDTSIPACDACDTDMQFAESLIRAAAEGRDVFQIARAGHYEWEHLDMS